MKLLLDTSIIIDFARRPDRENSPLFKLAQKYSDFYVADITIAELYSGRQIWQFPHKMSLLKKILDQTQQLHSNQQICILAGQIRAEKQIALMDAMIAATAISHQLPLATLNLKDFEKVTQLKIAKFA